MTATTINAGPGNDVINVDANGWLAGGTVKNIVSPLTINGQADTNARNAGGFERWRTFGRHNHRYQVGAQSGDTFFGLGGGLTYSGISALKLDAGAGGNLFFILGTNQDTKTTLMPARAAT